MLYQLHAGFRIQQGRHDRVGFRIQREPSVKAHRPPLSAKFFEALRVEWLGARVEKLNAALCFITRENENNLFPHWKLNPQRASLQSDATTLHTSTGGPKIQMNIITEKSLE